MAIKNSEKFSFFLKLEYRDTDHDLAIRLSKYEMVVKSSNEA